MAAYEMTYNSASKSAKPPKFTELNDLVGSNVGGKILFATDDWFAVAENMLKPDAPVWKEGVFTDCGKWMDGWETRRKRSEGHDWAIIQLGVPGVIHGIDVDTLFFTGNYAPRCSIQAATIDKKYTGRPERQIGNAASDREIQEIDQLHSEDWKYLVPLSPLQAGYKATSHNYFQCSSKERFTHIRINLYPDGGVARLHVYGTACLDWSNISSTQVIDLVAMESGGMCIGYSDSHYGHPRNLIQPGRAETMAGGWETARKVHRPAVLQADKHGILQVSGTDWCVFRLGHPGLITQIEIDTNHFKGNFPDSCRIEACNIQEQEEGAILQPSNKHVWKTLLPNTKLCAHKRLYFDSSVIKSIGVVSHVKLIIAPDGGISRMRLFGQKAMSQNSKL